MSQERIRTVIVSDKEERNLRPRIQEAFGKNSRFEVVLLSRVKIFRIRQEIAKQNPDLVFIVASLFHPEEVNELRGFVKKVKRHLPRASIIIHTPRLPDSQLKEIFEAGAKGWVDERLAFEFLGEAVKSILEGKQTFPSSQVIGREYPMFV